VGKMSGMLDKRTLLMYIFVKSNRGNFFDLNKLPRRKQRGILRHAGLDPASSPVSGFRRPPE
jgi:hypothetical protein